MGKDIVVDYEEVFSNHMDGGLYMRKSLKLFIGLVLVVSMLLVGCTETKITDSNNVDQDVKLLEEKLKGANIEKDYLQKRADTAYSIIDEQRLIISSIKNKEFQEKYYVFPVHTANIDTYEKEISLYMTIPKDASIKDQLDVLAQKLSNYNFRKLPINVLRIEEVDNKKIAVVNLEETKKEDNLEVYSPTWNTGYFQGSAGGLITTVTLVDTFLQRDHEGDWIDGVRFLYNNKETKEFEYEHVGLFNGPHYREINAPIAPQ